MAARNDLQKIDLSLDRIKSILDKLGNPQLNFPIVHVAGTNGKGSTIHFLSSILRHAVGLNVATFTTPHLRDERDTCQIAGRPVDQALWKAASEEVSEVQTKHDISCTPFEVLTAKAFSCFDAIKGQDRPDILLVEVGIGGALDATNVFSPEQVLASVICAIDYDHQAILGSSLSQIALQKAGIIKMNGLCVIGDQRRDPEGSIASVKEMEEVTQTIQQICSQRGARTFWTSCPWSDLKNTERMISHLPQSWATNICTEVRFRSVTSPDDYLIDRRTSQSGGAALGIPDISLPATRAALMASHLAIQTLWAIAQDETACSRGMDGGDAFEHIRLQIAYALRSDHDAQIRLKDCVQQHAQLAGRASWLRLEAFDADLAADVSPRLFALVDGAHNIAAAHALRAYVETCLEISGRPEVTLTWILALSDGKPIEGILEAFFGYRAGRLSGQNYVNNQKGPASIKLRIAAVAFTTPVEGMPWVRCVPPKDIASAAEAILSSELSRDVDIRSFNSLQQAFVWAARAGRGTPSESQNKSSMIVCAGSLYLVSDVYRLVR